MGIIGSACILLIHACETLAEGMGIAPYFIAVILAASATSLPDTILSYRDALKGSLTMQLLMPLEVIFLIFVLH